MNPLAGQAQDARDACALWRAAVHGADQRFKGDARRVVDVKTVEPLAEVYAEIASLLEATGAEAERILRMVWPQQ